MNSALAKHADDESKADIEQVLGQALGFLRAGQTDHAFHCLSARAQLIWNHSFACYLAGLIQVNLGQDGTALPYYDRALALKPDYAEAIEARARLLHRAGRLEDAISAFEALRSFRPAGALTAKAAILHDLGRKEEAVQAY